MSDRPLVNDFLDRLRMTGQQRTAELEEALDQAEFQGARNGTHGGGRMVLGMLAIVEGALKDHARQSFAEAHVIAGDTDLSPSDLRDLTFQNLSEIASGQRARFARFERHSGAMIEQRFAAISEYFKYMVRQFDIGWANRGVAQMTDRNVINATTVIGVQQGSPGASQVVNMGVNVEAVAAAVDALAAELSDCPLVAPIVEMSADLDTVRAQLRKASPSSGVLREAGRSIRTVVESVAANALTPSAIAAAAALWASLGA